MFQHPKEVRAKGLTALFIAEQRRAKTFHPVLRESAEINIADASTAKTSIVQITTSPFIGFLLTNL
jgi:hypothetical protein